MHTQLEWRKASKRLREQKGPEKRGVELGLTSMGRAPGIKRAMLEERRVLRNASWLSKAEKVQRRRKEELKGGAGAWGKVRLPNFWFRWAVERGT